MKELGRPIFSKHRNTVGADRIGVISRGADFWTFSIVNGENQILHRFISSTDIEEILRRVERTAETTYDELQRRLRP